jgi:hypothetical protein
MRRALPFLAAAVCLYFVADYEAPAEETVCPKPRAACSLFSPEAAAIPTTVDEMLPGHLRRNADAQPLSSLSSSNGIPPLVISLNSGSSLGEMRSDINEERMERLYRKLERGGYLAPREQKSDNKFVRAMDAIFTPEVIEIGGTAIAFSPYTAIKRKNPLCLLNPVPIAVSW